MGAVRHWPNGQMAAKSLNYRSALVVPVRAGALS
jgi:hypothetical protein